MMIMTIDRKDHRKLGKVSFPTLVDGEIPVPPKPSSVQKSQMRLDKSLSMGKLKSATNTRLVSPGRGHKKLNDGP